VQSASRKTGYYVLEGLNSFATSYFFNYLLQHLKRDLSFGDLETLLVCVLHGFLYVPGSYYGGQFGQRYGYFRSLQIGFGGQLLGVALAGFVATPWAQVAGLSVWTVSMCFVWPMLEALVSEREPRDRLPGKVGLYNVVWAATAAAGVFLGGTIYQWLGSGSLYWLPVAVHAVQWMALVPLKERHDHWVAQGSPMADAVGAVEEAPPDSGYFVRLAWLGNPFNYMAINTVLAVVPALSVRLGFGVEKMGWIMSTWFIARALAFVVLWQWRGWHYRFGWFASAMGLLLAGFVGVLLAPNVAVLLVAQCALGWASAVLYYSSLFYAMDGSDAHGAHGGIHEAFIGCGILGGPAVSSVAVWATGRADSPAWAVGAFLAAGLVVACLIRYRAIRSHV